MVECRESWLTSVTTLVRTSLGRGALKEGCGEEAKLVLEGPMFRCTMMEWREALTEGEAMLLLLPPVYVEKILLVPAGETS